MTSLLSRELPSSKRPFPLSPDVVRQIDTIKGFKHLLKDRELNEVLDGFTKQLKSQGVLHTISQLPSRADVTSKSNILAGALKDALLPRREIAGFFYTNAPHDPKRAEQLMDTFCRYLVRNGEIH